MYVLSSAESVRAPSEVDFLDIFRRKVLPQLPANPPKVLFEYLGIETCFHGFTQKPDFVLELLHLRRRLVRIESFHIHIIKCYQAVGCGCFAQAAKHLEQVLSLQVIGHAKPTKKGGDLRIVAGAGEGLGQVLLRKIDERQNAARAAAQSPSRPDVGV